MEDSLASMIHNYKHGFSGFAAMLTEDQAKQLAGQASQPSCSNNEDHVTSRAPQFRGTFNLFRG